MKTYLIIKLKKVLTLTGVLLVLGCQYEDKDLQDVKYSKDPNVFIDTFSGGLNYAAFSNTDIFAFQVDNQVTYNNSIASMRFDVPNVNDPAGAYAGGAFFTSVGRDLTSYNALTFWAKSSVAATVGVAGIGIDLGKNKYPASIDNLKLSTVWRKFIIPIPDASKLKMERGMFYISAGADKLTGNGYSFWVDDVKFENLGTIAYPTSTFNLSSVNSFVGISSGIAGLTLSYNMPNTTSLSVNASSNYFNFSSTNENVALVNAEGLLKTVGIGSAEITATLDGVKTNGSLKLEAFNPKSKENVISVFCDAYENVPVEYYNGYWAPYQTTLSADFVSDGMHVLNYTKFNFVGIQFSRPTIDATSMTYLHMDIFIPELVGFGGNFKIEINDFGDDGAYGGGDDTSQTYIEYGLVSNSWNAIDIPLYSANRAHLGQLVFSSTNISSFSADNVYFYKN